MPQLDPSTFTSQLFWLVVTFVVLYIIVVRKALPRISEVLEARQAKIDDDLQVASNRKEEAAKVLAEYEEMLAASHAKAHELLRAAQEEMAAEAARQNEAMGARLAEQASAAEKRIAGAKTEALDHLSEVVAEVAAAATTKLIGQEVAADRVKKAVDAAMGKG